MSIQPEHSQMRLQVCGRESDIGLKYLAALRQVPKRFSTKEHRMHKEK